jgi:hypothetical protein
MSSERDSFAKGIFSTFAKGFLLHKLLLKVNFSPLRVKKSRSHDMGQCRHGLNQFLNVQTIFLAAIQKVEKLIKSTLENSASASGLF